jgi:hypothetical protein
MNIEIHQPELKALIRQRMASGRSGASRGFAAGS